MSATSKLVLPPQYSRRIFYTSFLSLASVGSAAYNDCRGCVACAALVMFTSLNYWRHPVFGMRRNLDMLTCAVSLSYQLGLAAHSAEPAPRNAYFLSVVGGIGCYGCSRLYSFARADKNTASKFHCLLHVACNVGNLILYDSLGVNWLNWPRA